MKVKRVAPPFGEERRYSLLKDLERFEPKICKEMGGENKNKKMFFVTAEFAGKHRLTEIVDTKQYEPSQWDVVFLSVMFAAAKRRLILVVLPSKVDKEFLFEVRLLRGDAALACGISAIHPGASALDALLVYLWCCSRNEKYDEYA